MSRVVSHRIVLAGLVLLLCSAPLASAEEDARLTVVAADSGFDRESGSPRAGAELLVTFRNDGATTHNVHVRDAASADPRRQDTGTDGELAGSADVAPGRDVRLFVEVPESAQALYLWCDIVGHEARGYWLEVPVAQEGAGDESAEGAAPGLVAALLVVGGLAARRREGFRPVFAWRRRD